jgi:hypothetical protein
MLDAESEVVKAEVDAARNEGEHSEDERVVDRDLDTDEGKERRRIADAKAFQK